VRIAATIALTALIAGYAIVAPTSSTTAISPPARTYDVAATEGCLRGLPDAVAGLPPASPPTPPRLFVYRYPPDRTYEGAVGQLGLWYGDAPTSPYHGVTIVFFATPTQARRWMVGQTNVELVSNVGFAWDSRSARSSGWGRSAQACLPAAPAAGSSNRPAPNATFATFAGYWGGHTRGLLINADGLGHEFVDDGCCIRDYDIRFRILSVTGSITHATATYRVLASKPLHRPALHAGERGLLRLRNGILTNTLTGVYFCSDPAWSATAACGA
jgi:hypothetical protein